MSSTEVVDTRAPASIATVNETAREARRLLSAPRRNQPCARWGCSNPGCSLRGCDSACQRVLLYRYIAWVTGKFKRTLAESVLPCISAFSLEETVVPPDATPVEGFAASFMRARPQACVTTHYSNQPSCFKAAVFCLFFCLPFLCCAYRKTVYCSVRF